MASIKMFEHIFNSALKCGSGMNRLHIKPGFFDVNCPKQLGPRTPLQRHALMDEFRLLCAPATNQYLPPIVIICRIIVIIYIIMKCITVRIINSFRTKTTKIQTILTKKFTKINVNLTLS